MKTLVILNYENIPECNQVYRFIFDSDSEELANLQKLHLKYDNSTALSEEEGKLADWLSEYLVNKTPEIDTNGLYEEGAEVPDSVSLDVDGMLADEVEEVLYIQTGFLM